MSETAAAPLRIGRIALTVRDLRRVADFYQQALGLHRLEGDGAVVRLGVGRTVLLELRADAHARVHSAREAGLFHTAFLLPTRADLGRWTRHAATTRLPIQGASDHLVSEALYLVDPEGNGIEIYADKPRAVWPHAADGTLMMATEALDSEGLMRAGGDAPWTGVPEGTTVGHVHLQVGALPPADAFYGDVLGFALTCRYPGASFFGAGGYHHHVGANIWNSRGATVRTEPTTGLADVVILAQDAGTLAGVSSRVAAAGLAAETDGEGFTVRDPWGTALTLAAA